MEISKFNQNNIIKQIGEGVESVVYLYNDNGKVVALKKLKENVDLYKTSDNKESKLSILKDEELLKNDIKILNSVYDDGKFVGYTSTYEPGESISFLKKKKKKLLILKSIQERYESLNKKNIYIGDFNENNFGIIDDNKIKLYDIDNFRVGSLDFNVANPIMLSYMKKCNNINNIDYYCFNYFALSYLSDYVQEAVLDGIAAPHFKGELKSKKVLKFIKHLENFNDNIKIEKDENGNKKTILDILK